MEYTLKVNDNNYKIVANGENQEQAALLIKALENFYSVAERYENAKYEYDIAKSMMEEMFGKCANEFGLKSIKSRYFNATYVPATEPTTKKVLDEKAVEELLEELGMVKNTYYVDKTTNGRKASVRWSAKQ